jgi:hypothetical protein
MLLLRFPFLLNLLAPETREAHQKKAGVVYEISRSFGCLVDGFK